MRKNLIGLITGLIIASQISACGLLLYPERKGRAGGRIDPTVAILNGVGCLFFLIPGLIAFAVDFHHGTIYLPSGTGPSLLREGQWRRLEVGQAGLQPQAIEALLRAQTELSVSLDDPRWDVLRAENLEQLRGPTALLAGAPLIPTDQN